MHTCTLACMDAVGSFYPLSTTTMLASLEEAEATPCEDRRAGFMAPTSFLCCGELAMKTKERERKKEQNKALRNTSFCIWSSFLPVNRQASTQNTHFCTTSLHGSHYFLGYDYECVCVVHVCRSVCIRNNISMECAWSILLWTYAEEEGVLNGLVDSLFLLFCLGVDLDEKHSTHPRLSHLFSSVDYMQR